MNFTTYGILRKAIQLTEIMSLFHVQIPNNHLEIH